MKKLILFQLALICCTKVVSAQAKSIYFELGGPGLASFNYDMRFTKSDKGIGGRIGIGGFSVGGGGDRVAAVFVPIGVNYLLGKDDKNYFEIGGGVTPVFTKSNSEFDSETFTSTFGHLSFGYRYQPKMGGFTFRANVVPIFSSKFFVPYYAGISFGYKF